MQTYQYRGFLDCVKRTYRTEHLAGFFRGKPLPSPSPGLPFTWQLGGVAATRSPGVAHLECTY